MELESDPGGLRLGKTLTGDGLSRLQADQFDDAGTPGDHELDRDVDLPEGDDEWIRVADGRDPAVRVMHVLNVGRRPKRESLRGSRFVLNKRSTGVTRTALPQTASASASTNWLL